jgi:excisionase family DNA binding protein
MAATEKLSDNYRTLEEEAEYLGLHPGSLRRMRLRREAPPALKLGNKLRFPKDATEKWLRSRIEGGVT